MCRTKRVTLAFALPLLCAIGTAQADSTGKWTSGEETYNKVCGYCHEVGVGPYLKGRQFPAAVIVFTARRGSRAMPAFRPNFIDDAALQAVADYIEKAPAGPNAPKPQAANDTPTATPTNNPSAVVAAIAEE